MNPFIQKLHRRAALRQASVVLPEADDRRVIEAANRLATEGLCKVHLAVRPEELHANLQRNGLELHHTIRVHDVDNSPDGSLKTMSKHLYERRKEKGMTLEQAESLCRIPLWHAAGLVATGVVDACVAGAVNTTGDVLRAGLQMIGLAEGSNVVSGSFIMSWPDGRVFAYADCAVFPYPDANQLATIAADTALMYAKLTGEEPRVAFLSFATKGSAKHEKVDLVVDAVEIFKGRNPNIKADGPLQFDAAFIPEIGMRKAPGSDVAGAANVYVFPNLDAGNIAYKITERLGAAVATGPIIQGLLRPMNDLSRGASADDIVDTACIAALMA